MSNEELTMSNEEAREILITNIQQWKANPNLIVDERLYIALDMAIKALEEQDDAGYEQGWADGYAEGISDD